MELWRRHIFTDLRDQLYAELSSVIMKDRNSELADISSAQVRFGLFLSKKKTKRGTGGVTWSVSFFIFQQSCISINLIFIYIHSRRMCWSLLSSLLVTIP